MRICRMFCHFWVAFIGTNIDNPARATDGLRIQDLDLPSEHHCRVFDEIPLILMHSDSETECLIDVLFIIGNSPHDKQMMHIANPLDKSCPDFATGPSVHFLQFIWSSGNVTDQLDLSHLQKVFTQTGHVKHISTPTSNADLNVTNQVFGICDPQHNANEVAITSSIVAHVHSVL